MVQQEESANIVKDKFGKIKIKNKISEEKGKIPKLVTRMVEQKNIPTKDITIKDIFEIRTKKKHSEEDYKLPKQC